MSSLFNAVLLTHLLAPSTHGVLGLGKGEIGLSGTANKVAPLMGAERLDQNGCHFLLERTRQRRPKQQVHGQKEVVCRKRVTGSGASWNEPKAVIICRDCLRISAKGAGVQSQEKSIPKRQPSDDRSGKQWAFPSAQLAVGLPC